MGYFLFPLMMVLLGNVWFKERLAPLQWLAVALACAGVTHELWRNGTFSWVTVWVFGSYPLYYLMRRAQGVPALTGLFFDLLLIAPLALLYLLWQADSLALIAGQPWLIGFIVLLGLNSALAMQLNLQASQMLPFSLFGMLSYLEPILLFALSLILLNEQTPQGAFISYGLIWLGLALMVWHGMRRGGKRLFNFKQNSLNNQ
jgi:chloramphenicol-sensitive protein RarD